MFQQRQRLGHLDQDLADQLDWILCTGKTMDLARVDACRSEIAANGFNGQERVRPGGWPSVSQWNGERAETVVDDQDLPVSSIVDVRQQVLVCSIPGPQGTVTRRGIA